jgi:alginate O-acetyltransferase complex protein AlgI
VSGQRVSRHLGDIGTAAIDAGGIESTLLPRLPAASERSERARLRYLSAGGMRIEDFSVDSPGRERAKRAGEVLDAAQNCRLGDFGAHVGAGYPTPEGPGVLFNSFAFLAFFSLVVVLYYAVPARARLGLLVVASALFYASLNPGYLLLLLAAALIAYGAGLALASGLSRPRRRVVLVLGVVAELGALFAFKYYDFFAASFHALLRGVGLASVGQQPALLHLLLPAGLSFYSFSCVSYLVDVYRGQQPAERHLGQLALYVSFFPKLIAGPIERAKTFLAQAPLPVRFDPDAVSDGLQLMLWGLFKKVVIADRLAVYVDRAYQAPSLTSPLELLIASYFFAFQIYCDFSGYTDIARGAARTLGFSLMENFRRPYLSTSVGEFWGVRWHISLSRWFRDYLYIPLGGSRVAWPRWYLNLLGVFVVSGLWHGANWTFVVWGALNGLYQLAYVASAAPRALLGAFISLPRWLASLLSGVLTFHLILIAWVFFRAASLDDAVAIYSRIWRALPALPSLVVSYPFGGEVIGSLLLIGLLMLIELLDEHLPALEWLRSRPIYVRWAAAYALLASLVLIGNWSQTRFVYMQF